MSDFDDDVDTFSSIAPSPFVEQLQEEQSVNRIPFKPFKAEEHGHNQNLAEVLDENILDKISGELLEEIEADDESREEWLSTLAESFKLLGLKLEQMALPFPGASGVYSTVAIQAITEFIATAASELLPSQGPAREEQLGDTSAETNDKAQRVEEWFNIFLTQINKGYYANFRAMLFWVAWAGMAIRKVYYDPATKMPTSEFIQPQDFIVSYETTSLHNCFRMTERLKINSMDLWHRQKSGMYRDLTIKEFDDADDEDTASVVDDAVDRVLGKNKPDYDKKTEYKLYECRTYINLEDYNFDALVNKEIENIEEDEFEHKFLPYIITIDSESKKILAIYNDWDENDPDKKRNEVYSAFGYAQGPGFYKLGAAQLIGGTTKTASDLLRNTVNGLYLSNMPGGLYAKGTRLENNNLTISPGQFVPIDTGGMSINDIFTTMPYKEPSTQINVLRAELETSAARLMGTVNSQLPDFNPNSPVGTTYAILDVINLVQSEVMRALRESMADEFKLFFGLFKEYMPDEPYYFNKLGGQSYICAADFLDTINIVPVADAHVTSKMQKQMQAMAVLDRAAQFPQMHNMYEALHRYYKAVKVQDIDDILLKPEETQPLDPITENMNIMTMKPVAAGIWQDHQSHIMTHQLLLNNPQDPQQMAAVQSHIQQHNAMAYQLQMQQLMGIELPQNIQELPPEQQNQIAMLAAQATQQLMAQQQQSAPPPPLDPAVVMLEEVKVRAQQAEDRAKNDSAKIDLEIAKLEIERARLELEREKIAEKAMADEEKISSDAFKAHLAYDAKLKEIASRSHEKEENTEEIKPNGDKP